MKSNILRSGLYLGIDFGTKKMGVAVGQTLTKTATPLDPIRAKSGEPCWEQLSKMIDTWQPLGIVVGVPVHMDGTASEMTGLSRKFCASLTERYSLPVFEADERLSSVEAENLLISRKADFDRVSLDSVSAQLILEQWFSEMVIE